MADNYINSDIMTPEQIKRAQEHAYALLRPDQTPYRHWSQGAAHMLNALSGRMILDQTTQADAAQRASMGATREQLLSSMTPGQDQVQAPIPQLQSIRTGSLQRNISTPDTPITPKDTAIVGTGNPIEQPKGGYKLDSYLKRLFEVESNNNPAATKGSYRGLGQFSKDLEKKYGINDENWQDPTVQINAAARHAVENAKSFKDRFGYEPDNGQLYLMHQQGTIGGMNLMGTDPNTPAWKTIKEASGVSDNTAKQRILQNLPVGSALAKKPVDQITNDEYTKLWTNRFQNDITNGRMSLGGPKPEDATQPSAIPQNTQIAQAINVPSAVNDPSANVNKDALAKFMADPRIPEDQKSAIQDMFIKGAIPQTRETAAGTQQFRPSNPSEISMPGATAQGHIQFKGIQIPTYQIRTPEGKMETQFLIPGGGLGPMDKLIEWGRQNEAQDKRVVGTAEHETARYDKTYADLVAHAYGSSGAPGAIDELKHIDLAKQMLESPTFINGTLQEQRMALRKFVDGVTGNDPGDASATSAFIKLIAGNTLSNVQSLGGQGLGQVRSSEINIINKMNATPDLPIGAMRAVLDLNERAKKRMLETGDLAIKYAQEHNGRLDKGFDREIAKQRNEKPLLSQEEIKRYENLFRKKEETKPGLDEKGWITTPSGRKGRIIE